jgi:PDZ domain-containing secreted protein
MRKEDEKIKWYLRPIIVVLLLFFVLGPFALPLLYKSPKFSKTLKIILTIEIGRELYRRMEELQDILK